MNSLYTLGVRQTNSIQADLEKLRNGEKSASLLGQISASLAAMQRTVEDYDSMAKREIIKAKQEKAMMPPKLYAHEVSNAGIAASITSPKSVPVVMTDKVRLARRDYVRIMSKFRTDHTELRTHFEQLKSEHEAAMRAELMSGASSSTLPTTPTPGDARRRFMAGQPTLADDVSESPFRGSSPMPMNNISREQHALREHTFVRETETRLDEFIAQGRAVLDDLVDQRNVLKGTQRRLLDAANTLGLGRNVIGWIERRSTQDMYIFFAGAVFTFFCFFLIWKYLG